MDENEQTKDEISLMQIFRLLLDKIKLLIVVVLAAVIVGAGFGVLRTYDKKYYGTTIEFYVNPRLDRASSTDTESQYGVYGAYGKHVMDNMVKLLSSELFAEQLMLALDENGEPTGLPEKIDGQVDLNILITAAQDEKKEYDETIKKVEAAIEELSLANEVLTEKTKALNTLWAEYRNSGKNPDLTSTPTTGLFDDVDEAIEALETAEKDVAKKKTNLENAEKAANNAENDYDEAAEKALKKWRSAYSKYAAELSAFRSAVSYSYYDTAEDVDDVDSLARSFIYVNISVLNDEAMANEIYDKLVTVLPDFVETNMAVPAGYDGTNCQQITRNDGIRLTNDGLVSSTAIKYALLLGVAAFVVACIAVIIVDRADKRLKTVEQITQTFNIPLLGVIPSIKTDPLEKDNAEEQSKTEVAE
ncbi:MAG: hypothetical protein IJX91_04270 [Clostridia bacterium]|nr:hypothetical protein [Clostridia bacterium]